MSEEKAIQKDAVFDASIEFIKTLTGMEPPPIEIAPPEVLKPFREFTEKVCSIFHNSPPQRTWVGLTNDEVNDFAAGCHLGNSVQGAIYKAEAKLKELNT
jgi:hypothetical protein